MNGKKFSINLLPDENGLIGRQCPIETCESYFKIKPGTGIMGEEYLMRCPYCGVRSENNELATPEQIEYAKSLVMQEVQKALRQDLKEWGRSIERSTRRSFIRIKTHFKSSLIPVEHYDERDLETIVICKTCALEYSIFGKFSFCPCCGDANVLQILRANLELVQKLISLALREENVDIKESLLLNSLEDVVSSFDSFGRNTVRLFVRNTPLEGSEVSFQSISKAREKIRKEFGFDFCNGLVEENWREIIACFGKRHLIAHNDGTIDQKYIDTTQDFRAEVGRQISVSSGEITKLTIAIERIGRQLQSGLSNWKDQFNKGTDEDGKQE
ncbi:MAG: hypothetical protein EPO32_10255 [Anaerolineae bacterium]|nr:MAG: hypothetical protein EPO32_10255 [Anaerolineae bacterium]